jgi:nucleotide-binding universal stress UspA family protein
VPTRSRPHVPSATRAERSAARPVLLATFDVPLDAEAVEVAVDAAVEARSRLLVVNVVETPFMPSTLAMWDYVVRPEIEESLRRPAELAKSLGLEVERLRVRSPHPVEALVQVVGEREPGLVVLGPDRSRLRARRYRRAAKAVRERVNCLVWVK